MGALGTLRCASLLAANVDALYEEAAELLETALLAACADFRPDAYCKVCGLHALQCATYLPVHSSNGKMTECPASDEARELLLQCKLPTGVGDAF